MPQSRLLRWAHKGQPTIEKRFEQVLRLFSVA